MNSTRSEAQGRSCSSRLGKGGAGDQKDETKAKAPAETKAKPQPEGKVEPTPKTKVEPTTETKAEPKPEAKAGPRPDAKAEPKTEATAGPKSQAKANPPADLNLQIVKRVHELYEELGREDVRAVEEWEKAEQKAQENKPHK